MIIKKLLKKKFLKKYGTNFILSFIALHTLTSFYNAFVGDQGFWLLRDYRLYTVQNSIWNIFIYREGKGFKYISLLDEQGRKTGIEDINSTSFFFNRSLYQYREKLQFLGKGKSIEWLCKGTKLKAKSFRFPLKVYPTGHNNGASLWSDFDQHKKKELDSYENAEELSCL